MSLRAILTGQSISALAVGALFALSFVSPGHAVKVVPTETITISPEDTTPGLTLPQDAKESEIDGKSVDDGGFEDDAEPLVLPDILRDPSVLPKPVQRLREQLIDAAKSGEIEKLRPILEANEVPPTLSFGSIDDPIEYLKSVSGDGDGHEILAILLEVLESGFVHTDIGTPQEMFVWPYFFSYPADSLTPQQRVELFTILTAGDFEDMKVFGAYIFYRVGIGPDGTWHYFVAGD